MDNSDKWWRITIFWVIPLHHCKKTAYGGEKNKLLFTTKTTPQWSLHMLIIQVILVHYASFEANNLQMQQKLQQNGKAS